MAVLDYALLAEYARVDAAGLLTVVGASFDRVKALNQAAAQQVFVAIRVLLDEAEAAADFQIAVSPPKGEFALSLSGQATRNADAEPVDGKIAVVVTVGVVVPLPSPGRYVVSVTLGDHEGRELPFVVEYAAADSV